MAYYQKVPVKVQAIQWIGTNEIEIMDFVGKKLRYSIPPNGYEHDNEITNDIVNIFIPSREGELKADRYDWIIKGWSKEYGVHCWVCKPDYFRTAYEKCEDQKTDWLMLYEFGEEYKNKWEQSFNTENKKQ